MIGLLLRLPFLPVDGVIKIGEIIRDEADRQLGGAAAARRELEWAEAEVVAGRMDPAQARQLEVEVASRLTRSEPGRAASPRPAFTQPPLRRSALERSPSDQIQEGAD